MWLGDASGVQAPHRQGDHLVFDIIEGDMAPRVVRITVDVPTGSVLGRDALRDMQPVPVVPTLPATIAVALGLSASPPRIVTATWNDGTPPTIDGCISTLAGTCFATTHVVLDDDAQRELAQLLADVAAIPRCEPEALVPGDLDYDVSWADAPRSYSGHVPADESQMTARGSGPCRADARLAWWIARHVVHP